jgi:hypothetical protein
VGGINKKKRSGIRIRGEKNGWISAKLIKKSLRQEESNLSVKVRQKKE